MVRELGPIPGVMVFTFEDAGQPPAQTAVVYQRNQGRPVLSLFSPSRDPQGNTGLSWTKYVTLEESFALFRAWHADQMAMMTGPGWMMWLDAIGGVLDASGAVPVRFNPNVGR